MAEGTGAQMVEVMIFILFLLMALSDGGTVFFEKYSKSKAEKDRGNAFLYGVLSLIAIVLGLILLPSLIVMFIMYIPFIIIAYIVFALIS